MSDRECAAGPQFAVRVLRLRRLAVALAGALLFLLPSPAAADPETGGEEAAPVEPAPEPGPPEIAVLEERSVLTPRGTLVVQLSLEFSHSSVNRVALEGFTIIPATTIGAIDVRRVDRNTVIAALALRYGLAPRLEVEAEFPFVWRRDSAEERPLDVGLTENKITDMESSGLGDIEGRVRYQVNRGERGGGPSSSATCGSRAAPARGPSRSLSIRRPACSRTSPRGRVSGGSSRG